MRAVFSGQIWRDIYISLKTDWTQWGNMSLAKAMYLQKNMKKLDNFCSCDCLVSRQEGIDTTILLLW